MPTTQITVQGTIIALLKDITLKEITSLHSQSSARDIINENFRKLRKGIELIGTLDLSALQGMVLPPYSGPPIVNNYNNYVLHYDTVNNYYTMVPMDIPRGTQYIINSDEKIYVGEKFQYIIHDILFNDGIMEVDGQLVIFGGCCKGEVISGKAL
jgi:hypothetical protein